MRALMAIVIVVSSSQLWAAIPKKIKAKPVPVKVSLADISRVRSILNLPLENRLVSLKTFKKSVPILKHLSIQDKESLNVKWRSLTALGMLKEESALPLIVRALQSDKWYLRNVGLIAVSYLSPKKTIVWSKKLLNDDALVVRTAAVKNLRRAPSKYVRNTLWKSLYNKKNFKNGESLWIRRHIVKALIQHAKQRDIPRFVKILRDKDQRLHPYAVRALEKVTHKRLGEKKTKFKTRRKLWLSWWKKNKKSIRRKKV